MQAAISNAITDDLMAIKAHLTTRPKHTPGNLVAAVSWHVIGELYHVSQSPLGYRISADSFSPVKRIALGARQSPLGVARLR